MHHSLSSLAHTRVERLLQLATVATALGAAWAAVANGSPLGPALAESLSWTPASVEALHLAVAGALIALAAAMATRPSAGQMVAVAAWLALVAGLTTARGEVFAASITAPAHAARIAVPLVWAWWRAAADDAARHRVAALMRAAIAATFIAHGVEALLGHPKFVDYIVIVGERWHLWRVDAVGALDALVVIGVVDIAVGLSIIARPTRPVAAHMAFWGAVTAVCRVLYADLGASHEILIRSAHFALPLAIALHAATTPRVTRRVEARAAA